MEAKDTVVRDATKRQFRYIPDKPNQDISRWNIEGLLEAQAKNTETMLKEQWKQEGRREVLREFETEGAVTFLDSANYRKKKLWAIPYELWQAYLKSKRIKEVKGDR